MTLLVVGRYIFLHIVIFLVTPISSEATRRLAIRVEKAGARQDWANRPSLTSLKQAAWSCSVQSQPFMLIR